MVPEQPDEQREHAPVGFGADVRPLFRDRDRAAMLGVFDLWSYKDVVRYREAIAGRLRDGTMPCDGPWPAARIALFERWLAEGTAE
jgi:hypothetical protein